MSKDIKIFIFKCGIVLFSIFILYSVTLKRTIDNINSLVRSLNRQIILLDFLSSKVSELSATQGLKKKSINLYLKISEDLAGLSKEEIMAIKKATKQYNIILKKVGVL